MGGYVGGDNTPKTNEYAKDASKETTSGSGFKLDYAAGIGSAVGAYGQLANKGNYGSARAERDSIRDNSEIATEKGVSAVANLASGNYIGAGIDVATGLYEAIDGNKRKRELDTKISGENNVADAEEATENIVSARRDRALRDKQDNMSFDELENTYGKDFGRFSRIRNGYK